MQTLVIFLAVVGSASALRTASSSKDVQEDLDSQSLHLSKQGLWRKAWNTVLDRYHADEESLSESLRGEFTKQAQKLWKKWLQQKHAMVQQLKQKRAEEESEEQAQEATTTTLGAAVQGLLAGLNSKDDDDFQLTPAKTTTTSTESPEAKREREEMAMMQKKAVGRLTAGFDKISAEDAERATTTTAETTTTTTTPNKELAKLLAGVDRPMPSTTGGKGQTSTTTTTTVKTTTTTIGEAGRKAIAFISSGTFVMPPRQLTDTPQDSDTDDDQKDAATDSEASSSESEAASDFDLYEAGF